MCLAIPALVTDVLPEQTARISLDGVSKLICVMLLDDVAVGDYVIVHAGHAIARIDPVEAHRTLALLQAAGALPGARPAAA